MKFKKLPKFIKIQKIILPEGNPFKDSNSCDSAEKKKLKSILKNPRRERGWRKSKLKGTFGKPDCFNPIMEECN